MARPKSPQPKLCHHKATGRAYVRLDGQFVYLGDHGTRESQDEYLRVVGEWIARGRRPAPEPQEELEATPAGPTVQQVLAAFWTYAKGYYVNADGTPSRELDNFRLAMIPLRRMFADLEATKFGPLALKSLRTEMLKDRTVIHPKTKVPRTVPGWCRTYANRQTDRIRQIFRWAAGEEMIPVTVYQSLRTLAGLHKGKGCVRESKSVRPVSDADVDATLPHLAPRLQAMVRLQHMTGMRSSEVCRMTTGAIDRTGALWVYKPVEHKTAHHGHDREVYLSADAQAVVAPYLKLDPTQFIFSPREALAEHREKARASRKTPLTPSQVQRAERARRRKPKRPAGARYTRESYRKAIARACRKAGVPTWHPHRLRHSFATRMRKAHGIETARILLGHKSPAMTLVYAEADRAKAMQAMTAG